MLDIQRYTPCWKRQNYRPFYDTVAGDWAASNNVLVVAHVFKPGERFN